MTPDPPDSEWASPEWGEGVEWGQRWLINLEGSATGSFSAITDLAASRPLLALALAASLAAAALERLKEIQGNFTTGLAAIREINPITFRWRAESGMETERTYAGFSAQNVQRVIPLAVGQDGRGFLSISDRAVMAAEINAIKELAAEVTALRARVADLEKKAR
jgi:hypothetical protein